MIVANMATYPARLATLEYVLSNINQQFDLINLVLNEFSSIPSFLSKFKNINPIIPEVDLKASGKFLVKDESAHLIFLVDDDIIYPSDYVRRAIDEISDLSSKRAVFSFHGVLFKKLKFRPTPYWVRDMFYFRERIMIHADVFHFSAGQPENQVVDMLGTGVSIFRPQFLPSLDYVLNSPTSVDVRTAVWCSEKKLAPVCLRRDRDWLKAIYYNASIYNDHTLKHNKAVSREILEFAFKNRFIDGSA